jgi:hypothetical protein
MGDRERGGDRDRGRVLRPDPVVLSEGAVVPDANLIDPAPNRFTHELARDEPYRFDVHPRRPKPDGVLAAGTPVAVLVEGPETCRVATGSGLYVDVPAGALRAL